MKILWLSWKDNSHPLAGGAEVVKEELAKRLTADGHEVLIIAGGFKSCKPKEVRDGYTIIRLGNRFTVYHNTRVYYQKHLLGWADLVIDEVNTLPFFAKFYVKERNILLAHQLCREIWFYQLPRYIGWIGYLLEPMYLRALSDRTVITVSNSTKQDLMRHGFKSDNIHIISEGITLTPAADIHTIQKYQTPTLLSLGSIRPMKRTLDQIKAFELAKQTIPNLQLKVAGDNEGSYGQGVLRHIRNSPYASDIEVLGRVSKDKKIELMQHSHLLLVTSIKEGWGLVVTEANSQGTPAIVYDIDGLRDSVQNGITGAVTTPNPQELAKSITKLLTDSQDYDKIRGAAYEWSKGISFDESYKYFLRCTTV